MFSNFYTRSNLHHTAVPVVVQWLALGSLIGVVGVRFSGDTSDFFKILFFCQ